ncbi:MAG: virulence factor MviN [Chloroflexi bacterium]|nr:virulence factor MviN [Chloroflexota bacterium]
MKISLSIGVLVGFNLVITFLIQWYILIVIGPGEQTDALFASLTLPQFVLTVISQSLMHVLVPLLTGLGEDEFWQDAWSFLFIVVILFGLLALVLFVLAPIWIPLLVPGFSADGKALTVRLTRIQLITMVLTAVSTVLLGIYHARQRFIRAEFTPLLGSLVGLGLLWWGLPRYGIITASWVMVIRVGIQVILLLTGVSHFQKPNFKSPRLGDGWRKIRPLLLGTAYYKTDPIIDRFLLSMTTRGNLSLLYLGQQIYSIPLMIINSAIAAPMVPQLARHAKSDEWLQFRHTYRFRLLLISGLSVTGLILWLTIGSMLLKRVVGYGEVTTDNVQQLWWLMILLIGFPVGGSLGQILASSFYAKGNTTSPTQIGIIGFTIGAILKLVGFVFFGLTGIVVATTSYYFFNALVEFVFLEREVDRAISTRSPVGILELPDGV